MTEPTDSTMTMDDMEDPTTFDDVDVDEDVPKDGMAPEGEELTDSESSFLREQVAGRNRANEGRGPGDKLPVDPTEVN